MFSMHQDYVFPYIKIMFFPYIKLHYQVILSETFCLKYIFKVCFLSFVDFQGGGSYQRCKPEEAGVASTPLSPRQSLC